jgi:hypothetical protein
VGIVSRKKRVKVVVAATRIALTNNNGTNNIYKELRN